MNHMKNNSALTGIKKNKKLVQDGELTSWICFYFLSYSGIANFFFFKKGKKKEKEK